MSQQQTIYDVNAPPASSNITIVMPFSWSNYRFDTSVYSPLMTGNRLSIQELQGFLQRVDQAADDYKIMRWTCGSTIRLLIAIFLVIGLFVGSVVFMATASANSDRKIAVGLTGIFLTTFLYIFLIIRYVRIRIARAKKLHNQMNLIIQEANNYYAGMGLRFRLPPNHFRWIELWLDFKFAQAGSNNAPVQYPNVNYNNMNYQNYQPPSYHQQPHNVPSNNNNTTGEHTRPLYPTF